MSGVSGFGVSGLGAEFMFKGTCFFRLSLDFAVCILARYTLQRHALEDARVKFGALATSYRAVQFQDHNVTISETPKSRSKHHAQNPPAVPISPPAHQNVSNTVLYQVFRDGLGGWVCQAGFRLCRNQHFQTKARKPLISPHPAWHVRGVSASLGRLGPLETAHGAWLPAAVCS